MFLTRSFVSIKGGLDLLTAVERSLRRMRDSALIIGFSLSLSLPQQFVETVAFCVLLYVYKRRNVKHIVVVMLLVALLGTN